MILPEKTAYNAKLPHLLWVLDHTADRQPALAALLEKVLAGEWFTAAELPQPDEAQRRAMVEKGGKADWFN